MLVKHVDFHFILLNYISFAFSNRNFNANCHSEMFYSSVYFLCLFKSNAPSAVEPSPESLSELQPSHLEPCEFVGKQTHDLFAIDNYILRQSLCINAFWHLVLILAL